MFKESKASPATQRARKAGSRASEKKIKKRNNTVSNEYDADLENASIKQKDIQREKKSSKKGNVDGQKIWHALGYIAVASFVVISVIQSTGAFSSVNAASIVYQNQLAKMQQEKEKAQQAVADKLDVTIDEDNSITPNDTDEGTYYMDDDGNIICIDGNGDATVYYICTTCDDCGHVTTDNRMCSQCGSDLCKYVVYQVEKGDTLSEVSGKTGASVNSIAHLNELEDVNLIYAGESLRIPE